MEFIVDEKNNARNVAFLNKTKNQAKKLFKLAKKNQLKIDINNLSHAQEILAHINGFPHWHALETTIFNSSKKSLDHHFSIHGSTNIDQITHDINDIGHNNVSHCSHNHTTNHLSQHLVFERSHDIIYIKEHSADDHITVKSFFVVDTLPSSYNDFTQLMNNLIKNTSFQYNMGFHNIQVMVSQQKNSDVIHKNLPFFHYRDNLGISKEQFDTMFSVNITSQFDHVASFNMRILFSITTSFDMFEQHVEFCNLFKDTKFSPYISLLKELSDDDYQQFYSSHQNYEKFYALNFHNQQSSSYPLNDFISFPTLQEKNSDQIYDHSKWIMGLEFLSRTKHDWLIDLQLKPQQASSFSLYHSPDSDSKTLSLHNRYLHGLYKSLSNSTIYSDQQTMFEYVPLSKKSLPWSSGIALINHTNKNIDYYQPHSSSQIIFNSLTFAKPGSGKSLLLNTINLAHIFSRGVHNLPKMGIVDIGPSSLSFIKLVKETLSEKDQHLVQYHKLNMTDNVNIFDTQLGSRFPSDIERNLLINFLSLLVTPIGQTNIEQTMRNFIEFFIDHLYLHFSDKKSPKLYVKGTNLIVDNCIESLQINIDYRTSWWEIVDHLFLADNIQEARLAQCYAVPTLIDCLHATHEKYFQYIDGQLIMNSGETLIQQFNRLISDCIEIYPILSKPTIFHIHDAKIVVLDIDNLCVSGNDLSSHKSSVMYLLARYILGKDYVLNDNNITQLPYPSHVSIAPNIPLEKYKKYYQHSFSTQKEDCRILSFDEFHRAGKYYSVQSQIISDFKNSIRYGYAIHLASQNIDDFNETLCSLSYSIFILDSGSERETEKITQTFSFNNNEKQLLQYVHGPRNGVPGVFFAQFKTIHGNYSHNFSIPYNQFLLTSLSSTSEDVLIRQHLTDLVGYFNAINYLNKYYPYGVKKIIEQKRISCTTEGIAFNITTIINDLINDMIDLENSL